MKFLIKIYRKHKHQILIIKLRKWHNKVISEQEKKRNRLLGNLIYSLFIGILQDLGVNDKLIECMDFEEINQQEEEKEKK